MHVTKLVELVLKDRAELDRLAGDPTRQPALVARFLAIALVGFTLFGLAAATVVALADGPFTAVPRVAGSPARFAAIVLAYDLGLVAAIGVCLPSFFFYSLLAGVRPTMLETTVHAMKSLAVTAVTTVGLLPVVFAIALGVTVFDAALFHREIVVLVFLALPFIAGLFGARALYEGFVDLTERIEECRREARRCFLRRLLVSWSAIYTAVTPVMIWTLFTAISG